MAIMFTYQKDDMCVPFSAMSEKAVVIYQKSSCQQQDNIQTPSPKYPQYADVKKRAESFESWPSNSGIPVEDYVKAGFFYSGMYKTNFLYLLRNFIS